VGNLCTKSLDTQRRGLFSFMVYVHLPQLYYHFSSSESNVDRFLYIDFLVVTSSDSICNAITTAFRFHSRFDFFKIYSCFYQAALALFVLFYFMDFWIMRAWTDSFHRDSKVMNQR